VNVAKTKTETNRIWDAATKAKRAAETARSELEHAIAVVHVASEALATAQKKAADAKIAADEAAREAMDEANKARQALESHLGLDEQSKQPDRDQPAPPQQNHRPQPSDQPPPQADQQPQQQ
jgi:hypothetical protein